MADSNQQKDDKTINLTDAQMLEENAATDEDLLAAEEELLGLGGGGTSDDDSGAATGTGGTAIKTSNASQFHIPQAVKDLYPELIPLIIQTESMDDEEREYWFQILPIMTDDQVEKLREILVNEKQQLAKLDAEYEAELSKINEKHINEWQAFEYEQNRDDLQKKENAHEAGEATLEEDLLNKLDEL
ncbi:hypothetical protein ACFL3T_00965 [Patescibacteria group bacterium]